MKKELELEPKSPTSKEVVVQNSVDWNTPEIPSGFENVSSEDKLTPRLVICQDSSPEVKKSHPDYAAKKIEGIEAGDIFNNVTRQVIYKIGQGHLEIIPCHYRRVWLEFRPRTLGGGFIKEHHDISIRSQTSRNQQNRDVLPNGNELSTIMEFVVLYRPANSEPDTAFLPAVLSLTSTQLKKGRSLISKAQSIRLMDKSSGRSYMPPLYSHIYDVFTGAESNEKGSWYGINFEVSNLIRDPNLAATAAALSAAALKDYSKFEAGNASVSAEELM